MEHTTNEEHTMDDISKDMTEAQADSEQWEQDGGASEGVRPWASDEVVGMVYELSAALDAAVAELEVRTDTPARLRLEAKYNALGEAYDNLLLHQDIGHTERWVQARMLAALANGKAKRMDAYCTVLGLVRGWDPERTKRHSKAVVRTHVLQKAREGAERARRGRIADRKGVVGG